MKIIINENYGVTMPQGNLLGYMHENKLRKIQFLHPKFENGLYVLKIKYPDGVIYEASIENGIMEVYGSLLRMECEVRCQFCAFVSAENSPSLVFESEIFTMKIGAAIEGESEPIPTYEQSKDILEEIMEIIKHQECSGEMLSMPDGEISEEYVKETEETT